MKKKITEVGTPLILTALFFSLLFFSIYSNKGFLQHPDFLFRAETLDLEQLKSHELPIILLFATESYTYDYATVWPMEKYNETYQGEVILKFVDVHKYPELANEFPVTSIPTWILIDADGNPYQPSNKEIQLVKSRDRSNGSHIFTLRTGLLPELGAVLADMTQ